MRKPDVTTILGVTLGPGLLLVGNVLEGGHTSALLQGTAGLIVMGGTVGCVLVGFPLEVVIKTARDLIEVVMHHRPLDDDVEHPIADSGGAREYVGEEQVDEILAVGDVEGVGELRIVGQVPMLALEHVLRFLVLTPE